MGRLRNLIIKDEVCPWWLIRTFDNPLRRLLQKPDEILKGLVKEGDTAVDIGCGIGYFTIPLARMVGKSGKVIAVDLQEKMLKGMEKRAIKNSLKDRIISHKCTPDSLDVKEPADFILAFYMVHEVPDQERLFGEIKQMLKPAGHILVVEPGMHVKADAFEKTVKTAQSCGLNLVALPRFSFSRAAVFANQGN
ncbi:MAG TPA: class I SAM-dependent methyltransferase [Desulfomonilia bacterium]